MPDFRLHPFTREDGDAIATWKYDGLYSFYDTDADAADLAMMLDPLSWEDMYYAAEDECGELVGFFQFTRDGETVEIGLGLRPDLTGRGIGLAFLEAGLTFARTHYAIRQFRLAVATFNLRAIKVYERAGFRAGRTFSQHTNGGMHEFLEMVRPAIGSEA